MKTNSENLKLSLDDLQLESFVTSIDSEMAARLSGGLGALEHPTHTEPTDTEDTPHAQCTTIVC
ncbi:pinensin family lanthipeptide [Chitinophaga sp. LS1]|uniref:pinensin family lanthipeptide n=1 Tax=Chitinophaga sp. LS1 TaxID=3051176 RepID=UPI002AAC2E42|nr:pinensin family lanthipeptide [Chitinophaga sp. LS1]WPV66367.1 pinensin family lanthipeptide [Chitinophaga sp. LS1]